MTDTGQAEARKFEYDVAISFHREDEALATEIADLLQDRFKTFIYSKHQEKLAGRDGEDIFGEVFHDQARLVIVLHRPEWGQTPFTRIEETAIRKRAYEEGFDFSLFIPTVKPPAVPKWLPPTRLYYGLERFGTKGLAAVVESKIEALGGEPRIESVADRTARFQRAAVFKHEQEQFRRSKEGVQAFLKAAETLATVLETLFAGLKASAPALDKMYVRRERDCVMVFGRIPVLIVSWTHDFINSLEGAAITAAFFDGVPRRYGNHRTDAKQLKELAFSFDLIRPATPAFIRTGSDQTDIFPDVLAEEIARTYLDIAEQELDA